MKDPKEEIALCKKRLAYVEAEEKKGLKQGKKIMEQVDRRDK